MTRPVPPFVATPEQQRAIEHPLAPLLVVAGAGTGKTSVMAHRMLHLVEHGEVGALEILGLTFTNKAAANLKRRVSDRFGPNVDVAISTYHSFGASLVAAHSLELGLDPRTQVLNRAQAWQLLYAVFDDFRFDKRSAYVPRVVVDDALSLASRCADHLVPIDAVVADCVELINEGTWERQRETAAKRLELCQVVRAYDRRKRERNLIDYGDQINLAVRLLKENPEVAERLRAQHPVVLLDEYQDTNYAQRVLLQLIYPAASAVTAVGDDMQSIYGFRGAHLGNILEFENHFPPAARLPLETNRRSGPALVELANRIQAQVTRAHPKALIALPEAAPTTIECFVGSDETEEAAEIARDIVAAGPPWDDHAVLCRKRRLIPPIAAALEAANVPVDVVGGGGLLDRPEVVDLVSWLEFLADQRATVALLRLLRGPRYRVGLRDLAAIARHARALSDDERRATPADALAALEGIADLSPEASGRLRQFVAEHAALSAMAQRMSVLDLCETIAQTTALWSDAGNRGRENLLRFFDLASKFAPVDGDPGLAPFVEYMKLVDESEEEVAEAHPSELAAMRVMTVHQAKGLEFANVWVPGLAGGGGRGAGIFPDSRLAENPLGQASALPWWLRPDDEGLPHWRDVEKERDLTDELRTRRADEEWRLFYVACTRAQRRLVLSTAQWYAGPAAPQGPSDFYRFVAAQSDIVTERFHHEPAATDPAVAARERRRVAASTSTAPRRDRREAPDLFSTAGVDVVPPAHRPVPVALSVTALVDYARCPLQFYWSVVRPLPRRQSRAAAVGSAVHEWIESRAGTPVVVRDDPTAAHDGDEPVQATVTTGEVAALQQSFLASVYATRTPVRVEAPFELVLGGSLVRGRVDAVYEHDSITELVDFKTGRKPYEGDASAGIQLDLYAIAAADTWGVDPDRLQTTYCYIGGAGVDAVTTTFDASALGEVRERATSMLGSIRARRFGPSPGEWCRGCDFLQFCEAGQRAVTT